MACGTNPIRGTRTGDCVEINPDKLGAVPVLKGTRISVAQVLAEIGEGQSVEAVADDFDLDVELEKRLVTGLAVCLDRPILPGSRSYWLRESNAYLSRLAVHVGTPDVLTATNI